MVYNIFYIVIYHTNYAPLSTPTGPTGRVIMIDDDYLTSEHMNSLKDWMIERDHLEMSSALGQGQFGKVFLGSLKMKSGTQRKVACKTMKGEIFIAVNKLIFIN